MILNFMRFIPFGNDLLLKIVAAAPCKHSTHFKKRYNSFCTLAKKILRREFLFGE